VVESLDNSSTYNSWEQVSGYFDGDGTPILTLAMFTIIPSLDWADSFKPQLEAVRNFLVAQELEPTNCFPCGSLNPKPVWYLRLYEKGGLLEAVLAMLPHLVKKRDQVQGIADYVRDRIQGEALVEIFNRATRLGCRSGFIREARMPYTHSEGLSHARKPAHSGKRVSHVLTKEVLAEILERRARGETLREISLIYGVSRSAIRRANLGNPRRGAHGTLT
jgi:hypothetical protein